MTCSDNGSTAIHADCSRHSTGCPAINPDRYVEFFSVVVSRAVDRYIRTSQRGCPNYVLAWLIARKHHQVVRLIRFNLCSQSDVRLWPISEVAFKVDVLRLSDVVTKRIRLNAVLCEYLPDVSRLNTGRTSVCCLGRHTVKSTVVLMRIQSWERRQNSVVQCVNHLCRVVSVQIEVHRAALSRQGDPTQV